MRETPRVRIVPEIVPRGKGHLRVYRTFIDGSATPVAEVFTFASMADVLGITRDALEGRYKRAGLSHIVTYVHTGESRPQRAFPLASFDSVAMALTNPRAVVSVAGHERRVVHRTRAARTDGVGSVAAIFAGERYYTVDALASYYDVSTTTVRNRVLRTPGLWEKAESLNTHLAGRPRRAWHERHESALVDAMEGGSALIDACAAGQARAAAATVDVSRRNGANWASSPVLSEFHALAPAAPNHATTEPLDPEQLTGVNSLMAELEEIRKEEGIERPLTVGEQFEQELAQWMAECPDPAPGKTTLSAPAPVERSVAEAPVLTPEQVQKAALEQAETTIMLTLKRTTKRPTPAHVREIVCGTYMLGEEHVQPLHDKLMAVWEELPEVEVDRGDEELVARANAQVDAAEGELTGAQMQDLRYVIDRLMLPTAPRGTKPAVKRKVGARLDLEIDDAEQRRDAEFMSLVRDFTVRVQRGATLATLDVEAFLEDFFAPGNIYSKTLAGLDRQEATRRIEAARQHRAELLADPTAPVIPSLPVPEPEEEVDPAALAAMLKQLTKKGKK